MKSRQVINKIVFISMFMLFFMPVNVSAANPRDEYKKIQKEIEKHAEKVEKTKRLEHATLGEIDKVNKDLTLIQSELRKYRNKLRAIESEIKNVENDISENKIKLDKQKDWLKRKLRVMQKYGYSGDVTLVLSTSEDISQLIRRWRYMKALTLYDHQMLESYKQTLNVLSEQESRLKSLQADLKKHEELVNANEKMLSEKKNRKETLLSYIREEKTSYEKMLKELKSASAKLLDIIKKAESEEYATSGFFGLKGKLPWPVIGKILVPYGTQRDPQFKTPVFKNGLHIKAEENSTAKAIHKGKVVFAEWFKGYGQLIIISHGEGYHTLYANLSEIFHKTGDIIKEQEAIGIVGESGALNANALYFEIRYKGKPLDPTQWLKKK
jgi:septal ring factor EnvC (AmiA/AmiB activator)